MSTQVNCEMNALVPDWVAGTLNAADAGRVAAHVATCAECAIAAESWRQFEANMAAHFAAEQLVAPPGVAGRFAAAVRQEEGARQEQARYGHWLAVLLAATVALVALLAWIVAPQHPLATLRASTAASGAPDAWLPVFIWAILGVAVCYAFICAEIDWVGMRFSRRRWL